MSADTTINSRIAKNTAFLYGRLVFVLFVNLFTTRILLDSFGIEDYGIYNVVSGFIAFFSFLNATLSSCIQRFYNYEGAKNGQEGFNKVFSTALVTHLIIAIVVLVLLESFGIWYVNHIMIVPSARIYAANILFQTSALSLILLVLQIPFSSAVLAREHMDFFAIVSIVDVLLKLIVAASLKLTHGDSIIIFGLLLLLISGFDISAYIFYCRKNFTEIKYTQTFDYNLLKQMISFSSWNLFGTFAYMFKGQGINMLLNVFFGPVINAARGIAFQISSAVSGFSSNLCTAFGPQLVSSYAQSDYGKTRRIMFIETKISFSLIALLVIPLVFEMDTILSIWLGGNVPEQTNIFSKLVLFDTLVCSLNTPCTQVIQATGNIRKYQIGSSIINLMLIPIVWGLLCWGSAPQSAFITVIVFSIINQFVCVVIANKEFDFNIRAYFSDTILRCLLLLTLLPIFPFLIQVLFPQTFIRFSIIVVGSITSGFFIALVCMFSSDERTKLINSLQKKLNKHSNRS